MEGRVRSRRCSHFLRGGIGWTGPACGVPHALGIVITMESGSGTTGDAVTRPAPVLTEDNHWFWDAARDGKIVAQKCSACHRFRHPPRPMCPWCHSLQFEITELSGLGEVYSYSILHHPQNPAFEYPVIAALIELEEGVRVLSNLVDVQPEDVRIGMPVAVDFRPTLRDAQVPVFRPRSEVR
jgi:uncharacterized OB-fold protein